MPRPRWPIFLITRNERPHKGWWGSRTSTTSGNDSSDSLLGTFLNPLAQHRQLRRRQRNNTVAHRWPGKAAFLKPLRHQNHAAAVPLQELHAVRPFRPENKNIAAIGIGPNRPAPHPPPVTPPLTQLNWPTPPHY